MVTLENNKTVAFSNKNVIFLKF